MPTTSLNTPNDALYENEIDFRLYRLFIAAHWVILVACAVAGALVAIVTVSLLPPRFEATTTLMILQPVGTAPA